MPPSVYDVEYVPPALPNSSRSKLLCLEDNEPVTKMTIKGRSPNMKHVGRVHRVSLDWLFERFREDSEISIKFDGTKQQVADFLAKGHFASEQWAALEPNRKASRAARSVGANKTKHK